MNGGESTLWEWFNSSPHPLKQIDLFAVEKTPCEHVFTANDTAPISRRIRFRLPNCLEGCRKANPPGCKASQISHEAGVQHERRA